MEKNKTYKYNRKFSRIISNVNTMHYYNAKCIIRLLKVTMGKMKELYIAMKEVNWKGTPNEFLTWWINNEAKKIDKKDKEEKRVKKWFSKQIK